MLTYLPSSFVNQTGRMTIESKPELDTDVLTCGIGRSIFWLINLKDLLWHDHGSIARPLVVLVILVSKVHLVTLMNRCSFLLLVVFGYLVILLPGTK